MTPRRLTVATTVAAVLLNAALYAVTAKAEATADVFWLVDRSTGEVTLVLLSLAVVLGILRATMPAISPRLFADLHVNVALVTIAFGGTHIVSTILGEHPGLGPVDALVPFVASYRGSWVGLGVISGYLYLAVTLTSWPLRRLPRRGWLWLHSSIYIAWALSLVHALGAGSDSTSPIYVLLDVLAGGAVIGALVTIGWRRRSDAPPPL